MADVPVPPVTAYPETSPQDVWGQKLLDAISDRTQPEYVEAMLPDRLNRAALSAAFVPVLVYANGAYPTRPAGAVSVKYIGPVEPTTWIQNDEWVDNS